MTSSMYVDEPRIVRLTLFRGDPGRVVFTRSDGKEAEFSIEAPCEQTSLLPVCSYDLERRQIQLVTEHGDSAILEMPDESGRSIREGRPVIYLDQNQWSTVAASIYRPDELSEPVKRAAHSLVKLTLRNKVILPMSFGHVSETCQWSDSERRYQLAITLAQLSRGWQLRDPLDVRTLELRASLARSFNTECVLPIDAITLAANAMCSGRRMLLPTFSGVEGAPLSMEYDFASLVSACGTFDTLLDSESESRGTSPGWVERNRHFRDRLRVGAKQAQQKRKATRAFFLLDTTGELVTAAARSGITPVQTGQWLSESVEDEVRKMPALGFYAEALHDKSVNSQAEWESNDLTDLFYLSCAAGYADHVVCERETAGVLRQGAQRLGRQLSVHRSLQQLMANAEIVQLTA